MRRRDFLIGSAGISLAAVTTGCGSILHGERCGQPHSRDIDWKIAALDGLGLLLFFIPGVVAFAVDFYTGAIYLPLEGPCFPGPSPAAPAYGYPPPPEQVQPTYPGPVLPAPGPQVSVPQSGPVVPASATVPLMRISLRRDELTPHRIEQVASTHTGMPISLSNSGARLSPLTKLDQFSQQCRRHLTDSKFGVGIRTLLDRWS